MWREWVPRVCSLPSPPAIQRLPLNLNYIESAKVESWCILIQRMHQGADWYTFIPAPPSPKCCKLSCSQIKHDYGCSLHSQATCSGHDSNTLHGHGGCSLLWLYTIFKTSKQSDNVQAWRIATKNINFVSRKEKKWPSPNLFQSISCAKPLSHPSLINGLPMINLLFWFERAFIVVWVVQRLS